MKTLEFAETRSLRSFVLGAVLTAASALAMGCSSSSSTETSGGHDASTHHDTGTTSTTGDAAASTLYARLGGHSGIRAAVNAIVKAELQNADIASYFFFQANAPANGHPTTDQIEECFTNFVGGAAGGPEQYPATVTDEGGSYTCRDLKATHAGLQINSGAFDEFVMIAGTTLTGLNVAAADVSALASALEGTAPVVVTIGDGGLQTFPGNVDAASRLDASQ